VSLVLDLGGMRVLKLRADELYRCKDGKGSFMVETTDWKGEER